MGFGAEAISSANALCKSLFDCAFPRLLDLFDALSFEKSSFVGKNPFGDFKQSRSARSDDSIFLLNLTQLSSCKKHSVQIFWGNPSSLATFKLTRNYCVHRFYTNLFTFSTPVNSWRCIRASVSNKHRIFGNFKRQIRQIFEKSNPLSSVGPISILNLQFSRCDRLLFIEKWQILATLHSATTALLSVVNRQHSAFLWV